MNSDSRRLAFGVAAALAAGGAWVGGPIGVVAVALMALAGVRAFPSDEDAPLGVPATPAPPETIDEDFTADGLNPLPLEPTETRHDADEMGQAWRAALDACVDGLLLTGPDERVLYANPAVAQILQTVPLDLLGADVGTFFPGIDDEENSTSNLRRTGQDVLGVEWRTTGVRLDGDRFPAELTMSAIGDQGMSLYQIRDIRDRVQSEERSKLVNEVMERLRNQALEASQAKSSFLANMSHELRTPLNAILGYSEMLSEELDERQPLQDVEKIRSAGRHLMSLINTILDLSKIEAGRMELFMEALSVELVVRELEELARPLATENHNSLRITVEGAVGRIVADHLKLRQILLNLVGNAFKFTENGEVEIRVRRICPLDADWIEFEIRDTGMGIPRDKLDRIFEEFDQADVSTTREFGGTGLGLSISRRFCQMLGGDILVESTVGVGSVFTVRLPANTLEGEAPLGDVSGATFRVLVIDDDPGVRELMARTLASSGYQVLTASTGEQGIERARSFEPSVITLDVMMPGMDGWSTLAALKADEVLARIPVVMVTMVEERRRGYALGATSYLTKPVDRRQLLEVMSAFESPEGVSRVLVVDDSPDVRELLRRILEGEGHLVREAADGAAALTALSNELPDLIFLDLMMPVMDGFEFLDRLQAEPRFSGVPVVVLSAMDLTLEQRLRLEETVEKVLEKGLYTRDELLSLVRARVAAHTGVA